MSQKTSYVYETLSEGSHEIRVVILNPGGFSDPITIDLPILQLQPGYRAWAYKPKARKPRPGRGSVIRDTLLAHLRPSSANPSQTPVRHPYDVTYPSIDVSEGSYQSYEALSYEWGSQAILYPVHVNYAPESANIIAVTPNLENALRQLRLQDKARVLWVDALCIDQNNLSERSSQVALMGDTFRFAKRVIVWLGPEEDNSHYALTKMDTLGLNVKVDWGLESVHSPYRILDFLSIDFHAIWLLLRRGYFARLWVRQELHLASEAIVHCGRTVVPWENFSNAIFCVYWSPQPARLSSISQREWTEGLNIAYNLCRNVRTKTWYINFRKDLRGLKWTDPRDAIYARLNLLTDEERRLNVKADYNISMNKVFESVVLSIVQNRSSLDFLVSCELQPNKRTGLPTWVPDWSQQLITRTDSFLLWSACGWISSKVKVTTGGSLTVKGIEMGEIKTALSLTIADQFSDIQNTLWPTLRAILPVSSFEASYIGGSTILHAICRALWGYGLSDDYHEHPGSGQFYALADCEAALLHLESPGPITSTQEQKWLSLFHSLRDILHGRQIIVTHEGYIGSTPASAVPGDIVCILLGCKSPIILSRNRRNSFQPGWEVVGPGTVPGLVHGEAIYGHDFFLRYQPVCHNNPSKKMIDEDRFALKDMESMTIETNPLKILKEVGIMPSRYISIPHRLDVPASELKRAGIELREFILN
jgi:hypothetical protein